MPHCLRYLRFDLESGEIELMRGDPISTTNPKNIPRNIWPLLWNLSSGELLLVANESMDS